MADDPPPNLQVKENKDGTWHVALRWHSGHSEQVNTFNTETEARHWATSHIKAWLDGRKGRENG